MQTMNFKHWMELQEGLGNFMLPMMLGAATPSAPPTQPAAMVQKPNVEDELRRVIKQQSDAEKFTANDVPELVKYAQNTRDALNTLEDDMSAAINHGQIRVDHTDENHLKIHHYFDELRTRLDTFIAPDNFEHLASAFDTKDKKFVSEWMDRIHAIKNKFLVDKEKAYEQFIKDYPDILNKAELRASWIRGSHPEDSKAEFERYKKEIEAELQGKMKR